MRISGPGVGLRAIRIGTIIGHTASPKLCRIVTVPWGVIWKTVPKLAEPPCEVDAIEVTVITLIKGALG